MKYAMEQYGFPECTVRLMRKQFDCEEAGTADKWGRKVWHIDFDGQRALRTVIHLKACDRYDNHKLFTEVNGDKCLQMSKRAIAEAGRKMNPRVPSAIVLDSYRPNYAKFFKKAENGECSICKPAYENYIVFRRLCQEIDPEVILPQTISTYVRKRVCSETVGGRRK